MALNTKDFHPKSLWGHNMNLLETSCQPSDAILMYGKQSLSIRSNFTYHLLALATMTPLSMLKLSLGRPAMFHC